MKLNIIKKKKCLIPLIIIILSIITVVTVQYFNEPPINFTLDEEDRYELGTGGYPRGVEYEDTVIVTYFNGNIAVSTINLTEDTVKNTNNIIPGGDRPMLVLDEFNERLICIFNKEGIGNGAGIGIAWAPLTNYTNVENWTIRYPILGPILQPYGLIGIWEPYLLTIGTTGNHYMLLFSNQTDYDPENPIDSSGYSYKEDGEECNQQITGYHLTWNNSGEEFKCEFSGHLSDFEDKDDIFYKDGMVSVSEISSDHYLGVFETFPSLKGGCITGVEFEITNDYKLKSLEREILVGKYDYTAPYITYLDEDKSIISYRYKAGGDDESIGFSMYDNKKKYAANNHLFKELEIPSVWPSIISCNDDKDCIWALGGDLSDNIVKAVKLKITLSNNNTIASFNLGIMSISIVGTIGTIYISMKNTKNIGK